MWEKIKKLADIALIAGFLGFIYLVLVMTYTGPVQKAVEDARLNFGSYTQLSEKFEEILQKNLYKKYGFINLDGRITRALRINSLNDVQKLQNGFLTGYSKVRDVSEDIENIIELNNFLAARGIHFLYILAPCKNTMYDVKFAPGYGDDSRRSLINIIEGLNDAQIQNLDMDAWFRKNGWHMGDVFWKTDHHWMPQAGLAAAQCTMELLKQHNIAEYDYEKLQKESYKIKVLRNWFLGSRGKRVGINYAGVDNILVFQPKFETSYLYAGLHRNTTNWDFSNSLLDLKYLKEKDFFKTDPHGIYMYGDLPYQIILNTKALNNKRVLVTGDSYRRSWKYFIATQFKEIHDIDLSRYTDGTFAHYVEEFKPDIVIMCLNEGEFYSKSRYTFGIKEYMSTLAEPIGFTQEIGDMKLQAEEKNNNKFEVVCSNLEPNQTYTLTIDNAELSGAKNSFVQMTLQNLSGNKAIYNRYFNANSGESQKWIFTTPKNVEDTYGIYLYAGVKGHTAKISVKIDGIRLRKGIFEQ